MELQDTAKVWLGEQQADLWIGENFHFLCYISGYDVVRQRSSQYVNKCPIWLCLAGMLFKLLIGTRKVLEVCLLTVTKTRKQL